jgi:hypothetical protein
LGEALTGGTVHDIRSGRAIGKTRSLSETFTKYVISLIENDNQFYVVHGRCQHREVREMITFLKELDDLKVIYDARMSPGTAFIFEGDPAELGFAS